MRLRRRIRPTRFGRVKLHGFTAVASSAMFRRNPPKHTLLCQGFGGYPLLAFIHGLTPVAFCVGG